MKRFTTLFLVLTVIFTMFIQGTIETAAVTGESISLMTYNVTAFGVAGEALADYFPDSSLYISKRYQQVFNVMKMPDGTDPDIFCLQEVNNTWISYFNQEFVVKRGYELYGYSSNGGSLYTCSGQWDLVNVIGFKKDKYTAIDKGHFWCSDTPGVVSTYSGGDFARCINWVKLQSKETGRQFFVTSVHIDAKSSSVRELSTAQIASTMNSIANGLPVIIMGDFNCKSSTAAYKKITSANYVNAKSIASSSDSSVTYNSWGRNSGSVIDHCFLTKDMFTVSQYKVITTKMSNGYAPSDHYPVAVEAVLNSEITTTATPTATPGITATPDVTAPPEVDKFTLTEASVYVKNEDNMYIKGICEKTSASELLSNFVYGSELSVISENTYAGTGSVITDGKRQFTVIQMGDMNGDGKVSTNDYIIIKKAFSGTELSHYEFLAADIDGDGRITTNDYMKIKKYFYGKYTLYE